MRRPLLGLSSLLLLGAAPVAETVDYELSPVLTRGAITALQVTVRLRGDRSGTTRFDWADSWAGEAKLGQWSRDLVVEGAKSVTPAPHGGRVIAAVPGAPLVIRYRIVSALGANPSVADSEQPQPVVRPTWFYSVGEALFAVPQGRDDAPASFRWLGPAGIGFASDLEHDRARPGSTVKTVGDITESIVIGGRDLRVVRTDAAGAPLRVATLGRYAFDVAAFDRLAAAAIAAERTFWGAHDAQPFLVTMIPLVPVASRISYGGTGRSDAFALWMDAAADNTGLAWLLAHEYFHTWNPRALGRMADGAREPETYWLSEGFTDFYARRLMLRAGLITPRQFADSWNEALAAYATSPYRTTGNVAAAALFWQNNDAEKLPYYRGAILAAWWDRRQRTAGRDGLDTILRDQRQRVAAMRRKPLVTSAFARTAAAHGLSIGRDVTRFIVRGEPIMLPPDTFGRCATVATIVRPTFWRGYDADATARAGNVVTGLDPASPAYVAGLRNGMTILKRVAGQFGDSRVDYALLVRDGGTERTITFRPAGGGTETVQQIVLDPTRFAAEPGPCAQTLAG